MVAVGAAVLTLAALAGIGALAGFRVVSRLRDLTGPLAASVDRIRVWLTEGPLGLDPQQVASIRDQVVGALYEPARDRAAARPPTPPLLRGAPRSARSSPSSQRCACWLPSAGPDWRTA